MKTNVILATLLVLITLFGTSCTDKAITDFSKIKPINVYVIGKDTCNMTDENGMRQGKWIPNYNNALKDTLYYKDGEVVQK